MGDKKSMESRMKKYERMTIERLLDAGFYVKKQYGVLVFGETSTVKTVSFFKANHTQMVVPTTVESFSRLRFNVNDIESDAQRERWNVAVEIIRLGLQEAGVFSEWEAEHQAVCSNCFYGYACDDSCPYLNRKGYVV